MRAPLIVLALLLVITPAFAYLPDAHLKVFAVAPDGTALAATLSLHIAGGSGNVWSSVSGPLVGTATQSTEKIAVKVAKNYSNEVDAHDYYYTIDSDASVVDGPSAGSAMALLVASALEDKVLPPDVGLTGTITNTGEVGPVGGVFEKAHEASKNGIKLFMIPQGEARQVVRFPDGVKNVYLPEYALTNWGMKVVETRNLDDVLKFAFSDIASLDINKTQPAETPSFIPEKISVSETEKPLEGMNTQLIQQTRDALKEAQTSLNQTLLDDSGLIEVLSTSLSDSQKSANEAELLNQNGYYYSSGNFAYLAKVNAYFVKDVSEHPELLDVQDATLKEWVTQLKAQIAAQQKELDKTVPIEGVEWYIAAQQRLTWAEQKTDELLNAPTVVVATPDAINTQAVGRVEDYEYARGWMESSEQFYQISLSLSTKSLADQEPFAKYYEDYIQTVQNGLTLVGEGEGDDAQRRLDSAKIDQLNNRHLSAAMNAASALALVNASLTEADSKNDIRKMLENKIEQLDANMGGEPTRYAWARLYLDHAKYYLNSANYYLGINQGTAAASSIQSGFTLALLAENTFEVTKDVEDYYASLSPTRFSILASTTPPATNEGSQTPGGNTIPISVGTDGKGTVTITSAPAEIPVTGILVAIIVFLGIVLALTYVSRRANALNHSAQEMEKFPKGEGSHVPTSLYAVDELDARLLSARQGMRHAQYQHAHGQLSDEAFKEVSSHYTEQMRDLGKKLRLASANLRNGKGSPPFPENSGREDPEEENTRAPKPKTKKWPPTPVKRKQPRLASKKK